MPSSIPTSDFPAGFTIPAFLPPPGVKSNFVDPVSRADDLVVTSVLCLTLMAICVIIRFYTKIHIRHSWGWDDWTCIPATIGTIGFAATALSTLGEGVGPHQWDVPFSAFTPSLLRRFVVLDMLYSPTVLMAKLSLLLLYLQVFHPNVKLRYCIYFTMGFLAIFYSATFIAYAVLSIPKPGQSQLAAILSVNTARDIPLGIAQGAVNVASDFFIFCLPIPVILKLQLPTRKKIGVLAIFMTGLLACIASAFGLYYRTKLGRNSDVTWKLVFVLLWVVVELTVAVICSCLTSFPGFFRYHLPLLRSIAALFSSTFKSFHLPKSQNESTNKGSSKRLATRDFKVTLGSRIDGRGIFVNSTSLFGISHQTVPISELTPDPPTTDDVPHGTKREVLEELAESQRPPFKYLPPAHDQNTRMNSLCSNNGDAELGLPTQNTSPHPQSQQPLWAKQSRLSRISQWNFPWRSTEAGTGYWNILSMFRTGGGNSTNQSDANYEIKSV